MNSLVKTGFLLFILSSANGYCSSEFPSCGAVGKKIVSEIDPDSTGDGIIIYSIEDTTPANSSNKRTCLLEFTLTKAGLSKAGNINPMFKMVAPSAKALEYKIFTNEANGEVNYKYDTEQFYDVKSMYLVPSFMK
jgi:hypothetical protein